MISNLLITSSAYVDMELQAELGALPPAFLPVGNRCIFSHQHEAFKNVAEKIYLTVPEDYKLSTAEKLELESLSIQVQRIPRSLSLGEAIVYAVNILDLANKSLAVLHGDTIISGIPTDIENGISVHPLKGAYSWAAIVNDEQTDWRLKTIRQNRAKIDSPLTEAASGYFVFANASKLVRSITIAGYDFVEGINEYHRSEAPLELIRAGKWLDFGHLQTYFQSRREITTQRAFNQLTITNHYVEKKSDDAFKMEAEASWFEQVPSVIKSFCPSFLGRLNRETVNGYRLSYLPLNTLSDLFVFGRLERSVWAQIFSCCEEFFDLCIKHKPIAEKRTSDALYLSKTMERLARYQGIGIDAQIELKINGRRVPPLSRIVEDVAASIAPQTTAYDAIVHGDFCMSNVFYDFRSARIQVIDPRGYVDENVPSVLGDIRYDMAKLHHSVIGLYDFIIAGYFECSRVGDELSLQIHTHELVSVIQQEFANIQVNGVKVNNEEIKSIAILLFISMVPLHADRPKRQQAFVANALRLYDELRG